MFNREEVRSSLQAVGKRLDRQVREVPFEWSKTCLIKVCCGVKYCEILHSRVHTPKPPKMDMKLERFERIDRTLTDLGLTVRLPLEVARSGE